MLNPRVIAIQGIGFSPIHIAIQGLIALLEEERRNVVGGGGRTRGSAAKSSPKRHQAPKVEAKYSDADILRLVEDKYQVIEAKREPSPEPERVSKIDHVPDAKEMVDAAQHAPVSIAPPLEAIPLAIDLPKLTTVVTPVDRAAKAKAQADAEALAQAEVEAARLEQVRIEQEAKTKRDEAAIVMLLMEL